VTSRLVESAKLAAPGAVLMTVADLEQVTLQIFVPTNRIGHVKLGQEEVPPPTTVDPGVAHLQEVVRSLERDDLEEAKAALTEALDLLPASDLKEAAEHALEDIKAGKPDEARHTLEGVGLWLAHALPTITYGRDRSFCLVITTPNGAVLLWISVVC